jgi:hypothetical protein
MFYLNHSHPIYTYESNRYVDMNNKKVTKAEVKQLLKSLGVKA